MAEVLRLEVEDLPEGWTPLEVAVVVKCLNAEGEVSYSVRFTDDLSTVEAVGMFVYAGDALRRGLVDGL